MGSVSVHRDVRGISTLDLFLDECGPGLRDRIVAHATARESDESILWLAIRDHENPDDVYAGCVLYKRRTEPKYGHGLGEFWYKDMSEHVGPCYYDVPKKVWGALTPYTGDDAYRIGWRSAVAERRAALAARPKPKPGDVVQFPDTTWLLPEPTDRFLYVEKSLFRPIVPETDDHYGGIGGLIRLRGWSKCAYTIVDPETVPA